MTGHPVFAAVNDCPTRSAERNFLGDHRAWLCARATGRVLDLGAGTGANFPFVTAGAEIIAAEPDPYMIERARRRAGFAIADLERYAFGPIPGPLFVRGEAVPA